MTFIYELDQKILNYYASGPEYQNFLGQGFQKSSYRQTDTQTDTENITTPHSLVISKKLSYGRDCAGRRSLRHSRSFKVTDFCTNGNACMRFSISE